MSRPIDADALWMDVIRSMDYCDDILEIIERQPAIEERKKGKWIDKSNGVEGAWNYCSVCGEQAIDLYDFCPNCGAEMRGD